MPKYRDKTLLKTFKRDGKFIKLDVGDSFTGVYKGWKSEKDEKYDKMKPVFHFISEKGEKKQLGTSSQPFLKKISEVIPGSLIKITKIGEAQKTDFTIKVIKEGRVPKDVDEDDEEEEEEDEEDTEEEDEDDEPVKKKKKKAKKVEDDEEEDEEEEDDEDLFN